MQPLHQRLLLPLVHSVYVRLRVPRRAVCPVHRPMRVLHVRGLHRELHLPQPVRSVHQGLRVHVVRGLHTGLRLQLRSMRQLREALCMLQLPGVPVVL